MSNDLIIQDFNNVENFDKYENNIEYPVLRKFNVLEDFDMMVEEYLNWKILSGGAKSTQKSYKSVLNKLRRHLIQDNDFITAYNHLQSENMRKNLTPNYCGLCSIIIRDFSKHFKLHYEDYIPKFKKQKKERVTVTPKEFELIMDNTHKNIYKIMWITIYFSGLRISELLDLKVKDIDFNGNNIFVEHGKGDKQRIIIVSEKLINILKEYIVETEDIRENLVEDENYLFLHMWRNNPHKYESRQVNRVIVRAVNNAGIKKHITPHSLRHGYATNLLNDGVNIRVIQEQLGHENLATTQVYLNISKNNVKKELKKAESTFNNINYEYNEYEEY